MKTLVRDSQISVRLFPTTVVVVVVDVVLVSETLENSTAVGSFGRPSRD